MIFWRASCSLVIGVALLNVAPESPAASAGDLAVPDRANAYASIATSGEIVALAWAATTSGGATDIYFASSYDGGRRFGAPRQVNTVAGEASVSGEQPPRVVLIPRSRRDPQIVVAWTAKGTTGTRLLTSRSDDGGKTFRSSTPVPGSEAPGNRGWETITANRNGSVVALWLDHRELAPKPGGAPMNHAAHQHVTSGEDKVDGFRRAQLSQLFVAKLDDPRSARGIARGVCYCCKTALTTDDAGAVYAAWREVYQGNVRDIAFTKSTDGGRTFAPPIRVSDDNWVLDGCPENGPAIAVDSTKRIHIVWPTLVPGATPNGPPTLGLFYAVSADGSRFTPRQQIPTGGVPRHPEIAMGSSGQIIVVWDEQSSGTRTIAVARGAIDGKGTARVTRETMRDDAPGNHPFVATTDSGTIVGWTSGTSDGTVIRTMHIMQR
jgi:hypothetical protein